MTEIEQLERGIAALEAQRGTLGDVVVDTALAPLRERLHALQARSNGEGRRRHVTVLFADVSGYTALASSMDVEDVAVMMNRLWSSLDEVIRRFGGRIDKHIGDAVMAVWGIESAREDNVAQAIRAGLAMQEHLQQQTIIPGLAPLAMRIGIHTGPALLGLIDSTGEFTATGDTVNVTERVQSVAPVGGVLISHDAYRQVRGLFSVQAMEPVLLKGKTEPQRTYRILAVKPRSFHLSARGIEGVETRMIGRDAEFARLQAVGDSVLAAGRMQVVAIVGEAGAGKSRLLHEFPSWLDLHPQSFWAFKARADESGRSQPHGLWRQLLSHRFGIADDDPLAVAQQKLVEGVIAFLPDEAEAMAHHIGHLIGLDFGDSPWLRAAVGNAGQFYEQAVAYLGQVLAAAAVDAPLLIALEDLHWADEASFHTLARILHDGRDLRAIVIATARPTVAERWPGWDAMLGLDQRLDLAPLSPADCGLLIDDIFQKARHIPPDLRELIVTRSEGNPFFLEEMVKMLIDRRIILPGEEEWRVSSAALVEAQVPDTLAGVLEARLDGLDEDERQVLQSASVLGRVFWDDALAQLDRAAAEIRRSDQAMTDILARLCRREMVFHRPESTFPQVQEFTFKHAILHDVTYATVLKPQRRRYHGLAAAWLIERSGERAAEFAGVIAGHLQAAGQPGEAAVWFGTAGDRALATFAPAVAIHAYEQALALAPGRMEWLAGLGEALWQRAEYQRSVEVYQQMLAAAQAANDYLMQARALNGLSLVYERQHELQIAFDHAVRAAETARRAGEPAQIYLAEALFLQGWSLYRQNRAAEAIDLAEQSLALCTSDETPAEAGAQPLKLARVRALNLNLLGSVHSRLGNFDQATAFSERAYEMYLALGDRRGATTLLNNLAVAAHLSGHYADAAAGYRRVLDLCRETGNRDLGFGVTGNLAEALVDMEHYAEAEAVLVDLLQNEQAEARAGRVKVYRYLAEAQWGQGRYDAAWASALAGLEHAGRTPSDYLAGLWRVLGLLAAGGPPPAVLPRPADLDLSPDACFDRALALAVAAGNEAERAAILRDWGAYRLNQGDEARGRALWQEARARFDAAGLGVQVERMDRGR